MGAVGSVVKGIAGPILGSVLGAAGGSGNQGNQSTVSNQESNTNYTKNQQGQTAQQGETNQSGFSQGTESPLTAAFRQFLLPKFGEEFNKVQEPIYGDAQKAQYLSSLNDLAKGSTEQLTSGLAGRGALTSGRLGQGLSDIETNRTGQAANFFGQLPMLNEQARRDATGNLLNLGLNFAGRGPTGQINVGNSTSNQQGQFQGTDTGQSQTTQQGTSTTTNKGPGFWPGLATNLGGSFGGGGLSNLFPSLFKSFKLPGSAPGSSPSADR